LVFLPSSQPSGLKVVSTTSSPACTEEAAASSSAIALAALAMKDNMIDTNLFPFFFINTWIQISRSHPKDPLDFALMKKQRLFWSTQHIANRT
jgi:hypothetical protein